jgi:hypothetical protein
MKTLIHFVGMCLLAGSLAACSTVTMRPKGTAKLSSDPSYSDSKPFFLFGLIGEHSVDVKNVCGTRPVTQTQTQDTVGDTLLAIVTIGIYTPRTAKIWCENNS